MNPLVITGLAILLTVAILAMAARDVAKARNIKSRRKLHPTRHVGNKTITRSSSGV